MIYLVPATPERRDMVPEPTGTYLSFIVQVWLDESGRAYLTVESPDAARSLHLAPATLLVRVWRTGDSTILRGTIRLNGTTHWAPLQTNSQLEDLMRACFISGDDPPVAT